MSGFTPGPWVPRRAVKPDNTGGYDWAIIAPDKAIVAECFEVVDWAENGVDFDTRPVEANARLIAASPTLLEALQGLEDSGILGSAESNASGNQNWEFVSKRINAARSAIAKATGAAS